jgi:hypothetical protein
VIVAVLGAILISALNVLTEDTSAAAQVFFAFPIFWAASHLRAPGVVLVTAAVLAGHCLTLFLLLPPAAALTDTNFLGAVLVVMAVLLVRAKEEREGLVTAPGTGHRGLADRPGHPAGVRRRPREGAQPIGTGRNGARTTRRESSADQRSLGHPWATTSWSISRPCCARGSGRRTPSSRGWAGTGWPS